MFYLMKMSIAFFTITRGPFPNSQLIINLTFSISLLVHLFKIKICSKSTAYDTVSDSFNFSYSLDVSEAAVADSNFQVGVAADIIGKRGAGCTKNLATLPTMIFPF
jgi:hypothetical protein